MKNPNPTKLFLLAAGAWLAPIALGSAHAFEIKGTAGNILSAKEIARFNEPWAMTFLPDGTLLVTEKSGRLLHVTKNGEKTPVEGMWKVAYGGQGGLGDVVLHPDFATNQRVYLSYAETKENARIFGAAVSSARIDLQGGTPKLTDIKRVWTQQPKLSGRGHYSHRMAFGPKGSEHEGKLLITSGDRQRQTPAQNWEMALGKIIRLNADGSIPTDNPWQDKGKLAKTFWTTGHRNLLGIDFDGNGKLWAHEMGPRHGDELNLISGGKNYGWPVVSNGDNYNGVPIPDHDTKPEYEQPKAYWVPAISPAGLVIYKGKANPSWTNNAFIGGLSSRALIRVTLDGAHAQEAERFEWGKRVREVEQGPNGALWVLEDKAGGRLLKLTLRK